MPEHVLKIFKDFSAEKYKDTSEETFVYTNDIGDKPGDASIEERNGFYQGNSGRYGSNYLHDLNPEIMPAQ